MAWLGSALPSPSLVDAIIIRLISHGVCRMAGRATSASLGAGGVHGAPSPLGIGNRDWVWDRDRERAPWRVPGGVSPGPVPQMSRP